MMTSLTILRWASAFPSPCLLFVPFANSQTSQTAAEGSAQHSTPEQLVDALNGVFGKQKPDARAVHAKGIDLTGVFRPSDAASSVSKAPHLQQTIVSVTVRFSNFPGVTTVPDADEASSPRGMAIKFHLQDGSDTDIVAHSYNGFPTRTTDEFREFVIALGSSGPDAAKPTPLDVYLSTHPIAKTFLKSQIQPPVSYATVPYFGVNAFKFSSALGKVTFGRYQIRPAAGNQSASKDEVARAASNYLSKEIRERVTHAPSRSNFFFRLPSRGTTSTIHRLPGQIHGSKWNWEPSNSPRR